MEIRNPKSSDPSALNNGGADKGLIRAAAASGFLAFIKLSGFFFTGSLIVFASFLDSAIDLFTSLTNLKIHRMSRQEADQEHPFGHGGFEVVGSLIQGMILFFVGVSIIIESVRRISNGAVHSLSQADMYAGVGALVFAALGGLFIQLYLGRAIKKTHSQGERSLVLLADHAHYAGDVYSNLLSALGLAVAYYTQNPLFDPGFAGLAGLFFLRSAYPIIRKCINDIVHLEVDPTMQQSIAEIILHHDRRIAGVHHLRTRELGPHLFVDFHLVIEGDVSLGVAHLIGESVEGAIKKAIPRADVMVHLDPDDARNVLEWLIRDGKVVMEQRAVVLK
jgi:cation diffusion facilitator family transporter